MEKKYSIGEVAKVVGVAPHTVRFWADELPSHIQPSIGKGGRRYFSQIDIDFLKKVEKMINHQGIRLSVIKKDGITQKTENFSFNTQEIVNLIDKISQKIEKHFNNGATIGTWTHDLTLTKGAQLPSVLWRHSFFLKL